LKNGSEGDLLPTPQEAREKNMAESAATRRAEVIVERRIDPVRLRGKRLLKISSIGFCLGIAEAQDSCR
jgi:hypothetical protein